MTTSPSNAPVPSMKIRASSDNQCNAVLEAGHIEATVMKTDYEKRCGTQSPIHCSNHGVFIPMKMIVGAMSLLLFFFASAQEVVIPDAALKSAVWMTLGKPFPVGTLTEQDMLGLTKLDAIYGVRRLEGLGAARNLMELNLSDNQLTSLTLPAGLTKLTTLNLSFNQLTSLTLPAGLTSLTTLYLSSGNRLTDFSFLSALTSLTTLDLSFNRLTSLALPAGLSSLTSLTSLTSLNLNVNQLTNLTLPVGLTNLIALGLDENPLSSFILPEPLAAGSLSDTVNRLQQEGASVWIYSVTASLSAMPLSATGSFECLQTGPPGGYRIEVTRDFASWTEAGTAVNVNGSVVVADPRAASHTRGFYRAAFAE